MTDIIKRLKKSYTCRNQHTDDDRTKTNETCVDSQAMCMCLYEDRQEAAAEIERLREALGEIIINCDWPDRVEKLARDALQQKGE